MFCLAVALARSLRPVAGRPTISWNVHTRPLALLVTLGLHAPLFPLAGFIPTSAALFAVTAFLLGSRRPVRDLTVGVAFALVLNVIFTLGLGMSLPPDPITRWTRG
jgi:hypothetical protein